MQNMSQTDSASMEMSSMPDADNSVSIKEIISSYLVLKSALTEDNSAAAAKAGEAVADEDEVVASGIVATEVVTTPWDDTSK